MKKLLLSVSAVLLLNVCSAQTKKDTLKVDSAQMEKIKQMPMDTLHHTMPIVPLTPDSALRNTRDDADPKKPKHQK